MSACKCNLAEIGPFMRIGDRFVCPECGTRWWKVGERTWSLRDPALRDDARSAEVLPLRRPADDEAV